MNQIIACHACGGPLSVQAHVCPRCGQPGPGALAAQQAAQQAAQNASNRAALTLLGILAVCGFMIWRACSSFSDFSAKQDAERAAAATSPTTMYRGVRIGESAVFNKKGWIAPSKALFDEITSKAGSDSASATRLINEKCTIVLPLTKVRFLELQGTDIRVQVLDGPDTGKQGWAWGIYLDPE